MMLSLRRARLTAWATWVAGVSMIALTAMLLGLNPPISTVQPAETAVEAVLWLSTWLGFGLVGARCGHLGSAHARAVIAI